MVLIQWMSKKSHDHALYWMPHPLFKIYTMIYSRFGIVIGTNIGINWQGTVHNWTGHLCNNQYIGNWEEVWGSSCELLLSLFWFVEYQSPPSAPKLWQSKVQPWFGCVLDLYIYHRVIATWFKTKQGKNNIPSHALKAV